ncbi:MAG: DUF6273 domain-containing protein [Oscillospiraceae bacterium]|nr:DUF6273 domain-containing protein [Oscillospiraceae bacterium]
MGIGGGGGTTTNPPTVSVPAGQSSSEGSANTNAAPPAKPQPGVGDIILFGNYNWRVLEVRDGKALIITEDIMTGRAYNEANEDVTWETCTLRTYLNGEFYDSFVPVDRKRIVDTEVRTPSNPWYETDGGKVVTDKIFLLSIEEVLKYFGNSKLGKEEYFWFSDENDEKRKANFENDYHWWWLRSPGILPIDAVCVLIGGYVGLGGIFVSESSGGVRPALWIDLGP